MSPFNRLRFYKGWRYESQSTSSKWSSKYWDRIHQTTSYWGGGQVGPIRESSVDRLVTSSSEGSGVTNQVPTRIITRIIKTGWLPSERVLTTILMTSLCEDRDFTDRDSYRLLGSWRPRQSPYFGSSLAFFMSLLSLSSSLRSGSGPERSSNLGT